MTKNITATVYNITLKLSRFVQIIKQNELHQTPSQTNEKIKIYLKFSFNPIMCVVSRSMYRRRSYTNWVPTHSEFIYYVR